MLAKLWTKFYSKKRPISIMIVGLDNSGKTSILNKLASLNHDHISRDTSPPNTHHQIPQVASTSQSTTKQCTPAADGQQQPLPPSASSISATTTGTIRDRPLDFGEGSSGSMVPTVGYNYERIQYKSTAITVLDFSGQNRYRNLWQEFYNAVDAIVFVIDSSDLIRLVVVRDELETMLSHPYFTSLSSDRSDGSAIQLSSSIQLEVAQKQITVSQGKLMQSPLDTRASSPVLKTNGSRARSIAQQDNNGNMRASNSRRRTKVPILFLANKSDIANSVSTEAIANALNLAQLPPDRHPWFIQATSVNTSQGIIEGFDWLVSQLSVNR